MIQFKENARTDGRTDGRADRRLPLGVQKEIMHQKILAMGLTYVGQKSKKLKHSFMLLSTLHYLEKLIAECEKIMSYLLSLTSTRLTFKVKALDVLYAKCFFPSWMMKGRNIVNY